MGFLGLLGDFMGDFLVGGSFLFARLAVTKLPEIRSCTVITCSLGLINNWRAL